ncbi:hypothetical protein M1563_01345 [Patescibacteria group bacterium]|nr:hypothetical protein [Patescibacteria group bacterium]MCL5410083.1 hypothetical protein [Patescibacteria group bacterium]
MVKRILPTIICGILLILVIFFIQPPDSFSLNSWSKITFFLILIAGTITLLINLLLASFVTGVLISFAVIINLVLLGLNLFNPLLAILTILCLLFALRIINHSKHLVPKRKVKPIHKLAHKFN